MLNNTTSSAAAAVTLLLTLSVMSARSGAQEAPLPWPVGKPGCATTCGNISVPFPFGIGIGPGRGCYHSPGFNLTCDTSAHPPRLLLGTIEVKEIRLKEHIIHVVAPPIFSGSLSVTGAAANISGGSRNLYGMWGLRVDHGQYAFASGTELVVTGCSVLATLLADAHSQAGVTVGCSPYCGVRPPGTALAREEVTRNKTGFCTAPVSTDQTSYDVVVRRLAIDSNNSVGGSDDGLPVYVLIAQKGWFSAERAVELMDLEKQRNGAVSKDGLVVPVILNWSVFSSNGYGNISDKSFCTLGDLYQCNCAHGYEGNPYLPGGCQDIDECKKPKKYGCFGECMNTEGSFDCRCPRGFIQESTTLTIFCVKSVKNTGLIIGLSVAVVPCLVLFILCGIFMSHKVKHRSAEKLKQQFFNQNRGQLLQQLITHRSDIGERMIIPLKEIEKATNGFDETRKVGGGGHGTVYKGILSDLHVVAIKKSNIVVQREINEFINEVAILSQINHRNVVKLHGCCLETEVPLLAYEFISNGTLGDHLHHGSPRSIPWRDRLRISSEVAKAIAYLHFAVSVPIIHRDIKSSNVLLDDALTAKVSDFGASRFIPIDQTEITATAVQGTIGYLDPMYYYTGRLSQMSDVYSFGVLLVELLTRKEPIMYMSSEGYGLVMHFVKLLEQGNLMDILDSQVVEEGRSEVEEVASLAASCLKLKGEERPTMRHIEMALESLQPTNARVLVDLGAEQNEPNNIAPSYSSRRSTSLKEVSRQYSQEEEFALSARYPR